MSIRSTLSRFARHNRWTWRYGLNLQPVLAYRRSARSASADSRRIAERLVRDGIAISSVDEFPGLRAQFEELAVAVREDEERQRDKIAAARPKGAKDLTIGAKTFLYMLKGNEPVLEPSSVYCRFALQDAFVETANAYFGMLTRLRYYNVWRTFAGDSAARESQLWHRDRDDIQIVKVFVHLEDVDDQAGPFTYAPGTHLLGPRQQEPDGAMEKTVKRTTDEQMSVVVPESEWIVARGARGTIVFADTRGFHKGGLARGNDRLLFTCMFVSAASQVRTLFGGISGQMPENLTTAQAFALGDVGRLRRVGIE